jgi:hypothetical protein
LYQVRFPSILLLSSFFENRLSLSGMARRAKTSEHAPFFTMEFVRKRFSCSQSQRFAIRHILNFS